MCVLLALGVCVQMLAGQSRLGSGYLHEEVCVSHQYIWWVNPDRRVVIVGNGMYACVPHQVCSCLVGRSRLGSWCFREWNECSHPEEAAQSESPCVLAQGLEGELREAQKITYE